MTSGSPEGKPLLSTHLKQTQRLIMSPQMQQAIQLLQVPAIEMSTLIELEMEQNPLLEYDSELDGEADQIEEEEEEDQKQSMEERENEDEEDFEGGEEPEMQFSENDFSLVQDLEEEFGDHWEQSSQAYGLSKKESDKLQSYLESSIKSNETLYEHLIHQAHETFVSEKDLKIAEIVIGNIDHSGYLNTPLEEIAILCNCNVDNIEKVLLTIQTFDPPGVGARSLQEALLIELRLKGRENTLAYKIASECYQEMLHNQIPVIAKKLQASTEEVVDSIAQEIAPLDLHPGLSLGNETAQTIVPDALIRQEGENLIVEINDDEIPSLRLNRTYLKMLNNEELSVETKDFIRRKILSAKWLMRNIFQRNDTIERIVKVLSEKQKKFFVSPQGNLIPLTMRAVADELGIHESTVARAVSNKYIDTPRGTLPLRYFFTNAYVTSKGEDISSETVRIALKEIVDSENKSNPYSDEKLSKLMSEKGVKCARRTIAKYRQELGIGNALQRKKF